MHLRRVLWPLILLAATACVTVDDAESEDEVLGEASDAFTGLVNVVVVAEGAPSYDTEPVSHGTVMILSSVAGNLAKVFTTPYVWAHAITQNGVLVAKVEATPSNSTKTLAAQAWGVYPSTPHYTRTCSHSGPGTSPSFAPMEHPTSGNYRCFLKKVMNANANSWNSPDDGAEIQWVNGEPHLYCHNDAEAEAGCNSISAYYGAASIGSTAGPLSLDLGPTDWTNGKVCGLTAVWGHFRSNDTGDGVAAYVNGSNWTLYTAQNFGATVACVR